MYCTACKTSHCDKMIDPEHTCPDDPELQITEGEGKLSLVFF